MNKTLQNTQTQVVNANARSFTWLNYVDVIEDVMPWLQWPESPAPTTAELSKLQLLTSMTCQWAQKKLQQPIAPTAFFQRFDGWVGRNGAHIMLDYSPVLEVISVKEWWGMNGPHDLAEQTPDHDIDGYSIVHRRGRITRVFPGLVQKPFFPGNRNIEVQWVAGQNPVDADLKVATLEMIAHWWRNTQQTQRTNVRGGPGDDAEDVAQGMWEGVPLRIVGLLESNPQIGIA